MPTVENLRSTIVIIVLTFAVLGLLLGYAASFDTGGQSTALSLATDKPVYSRGDTVTFNATNSGAGELVFPDAALGVSIRNSDTGKTYSITAAQVLTTLEPGQSMQVLWKETQDADAGNYTATVHTAAGGSQTGRAEAHFGIQ